MPLSNAPRTTLVAAPATPSQRRAVLTAMAALAAVSTLALPFASLQLPAFPQVVPFYVAGVSLTELVTAFLLFSQFWQSGWPPLAVLGAAYLHTGLVVIPHMLFFPDPAVGLVHGASTAQLSAWLWHVWHIGFPALVLAYVLTLPRLGRLTVRTGTQGRWVALVMALIALEVGLFTVGLIWLDPVLPVLHSNNVWHPITFQLGWIMGILTVLAFLLLWRLTGLRTFLHLWLAMALVAFFFDFTPNLLALKRYTLGWYLGRTNSLLAASTLMILFLLETSRLYQNLGRFNRELEAQVTARTAELSKALKERELLLREVYHRVNNNLQQVTSLITLEQAALTDRGADRAFARIRERIAALGMVHRQLMRSNDLTTFGLRPFLDDLLDNVEAGQGGGMVIERQIENRPADLDLAMPLGLVVTELIAICLRAEPPPHRLLVALSWAGSEASLTVSCARCQKPPAGDLGFRIVEALVEQLEGSLAWPTGEQEGFLVRFSLSEEAQ